MGQRGTTFRRKNSGLATTISSLVGTCRVFEPGTNLIKYSNAGVTLSGGVLSKGSAC